MFYRFRRLVYNTAMVGPSLIFPWTTSSSFWNRICLNPCCYLPQVFWCLSGMRLMQDSKLANSNCWCYCFSFLLDLQCIFLQTCSIRFCLFLCCLWCSRSCLEMLRLLELFLLWARYLTFRHALYLLILQTSRTESALQFETLRFLRLISSESQGVAEARSNWWMNPSSPT